MKKLETDILASRALNAARKLHLPTYVATRFLLETVAGNKDSSWLYEVIPRKYLIQGQGNFHKISKFKKIDKNNEFIYREFVVPAPTTLLVEAILLGYLAQTDAFNKSDRVYSYLWPSSMDCPYSFEHYVSGYRQRNEDIVTFISSNEDKLLMVADIKKFYPSINQEVVKERLSERLESSALPQEIKNLTLKLLDDLYLFFPEGVGIATGSEFSHVIGDIALQNLDDVLEEKYGEAYFRYVDDIVLIIDPKEKDEAITLLEGLVAEEGLAINPDKYDFLTSELWLKYGPHNVHKVKEDSFEALIFKIKTYLQINPGNETSLDTILKNATFSIPLGRLSSVSKSSSFATRLIDLINGGWRVALNAVLATDQDIVQQANLVREKIQSELIKYTESSLPQSTTLRKWHLQNLRYLTNRAVYLLSCEELGLLIPKLKDIPEFVDTVALLKTVVYGEYSELLRMPGAALYGCAGLLSQNNIKLKDITITSDSTPEQIESAAVFALWDVVNLSFTNMHTQDNEVLEYLKFSSGVSSFDRDIGSFGYMDEVISLGTHKNKKDNLRVLESRFSDVEASVLDALDIWDSES